jgi:DNA modification methylase
MRLRITYQRTDSLIEYVNNPRDNDHVVDKMAAAIREYDCVVPLLIKSDLSVVDGHLRLKAARKLQLEELPCIFVDHLSDVQIKALRISINKMAEVADWDAELLALEIDALKNAAYDLSLIGFDEDEIDALVDEASTEDSGADDAPEVSEEEPRTRLGDVWLCGDHRVMCGDSTDAEQVERLMDGELADTVFTDPPYGYSYRSNYQTKHMVLKNDDKFLDFIPAIYDRLLTNTAIFICTSYQTVDTWVRYTKTSLSYKNLIVWKKNNWSMGDLSGAFAGQHELIIFAHKGRVLLTGRTPTDIWEFDREPPICHPTQKPVDLVCYALSRVPSRDVLDPFLGSGTTLIACEKTDRRCFGMELDPKYCDVIVKRWQDYTGEQAVVESTGETFDGS